MNTAHCLHTNSCMPLHRFHTGVQNRQETQGQTLQATSEPKEYKVPSSAPSEKTSSGLVGAKAHGDQNNYVSAPCVHTGGTAAQEPRDGLSVSKPPWKPGLTVPLWRLQGSLSKKGDFLGSCCYYDWVLALHPYNPLFRNSNTQYASLWWSKEWLGPKSWLLPSHTQVFQRRLVEEKTTIDR